MYKEAAAQYSNVKIRLATFYLLIYVFITVPDFFSQGTISSQKYFIFGLFRTTTLVISVCY